MKKVFYILLLVSLVVSTIVGCRPSTKILQIKGSDTMVNLAQAWVEKFMEKYPDLSVAVTGGGSGTGIASLISNTTDIAQCSREMKPKEIELANKNGVTPNEIHVANDGIAVVVHPSNPVSKLSIKQLSDIYSGKVKNWKEIGGEDRRIVALSRERNSGTHVFFYEEVVKLGNKKSKNEFAPLTLMMPSSQAIIEEVQVNLSAIGYIGLGYVSKKQKLLSIAKDIKSPYIVPMIKTITNGKYPISRTLLFYTNGEPKGQVKSFIDYVLGVEGQKIVLEMDFVPLK